jgi:hypothetical protein
VKNLDAILASLPAEIPALDPKEELRRNRELQRALATKVCDLALEKLGPPPATDNPAIAVYAAEAMRLAEDRWPGIEGMARRLFERETFLMPRSGEAEA